MKPWPIFLLWLTLAALLEWAIGRTFIRSAIYLPKTPFMIGVYQALGAIGQVAFTLTSLLALLGMAWLVWQERRNITFALLLSASVILSCVFIVVMPEGWWPVLNRLLLVAIITVLLGRLWRRDGDRRWKMAVTLPVLAVWLGAMYQVLPALAQALHWPETPALGRTLFNLGELLVVLTPIGLWLALRPRERARVYVLAALPALLFSIVHLVAPAMTGIMAIWSIGLTLYLPWPITALSVWLGAIVVISAMRRNQPIGWALLMLLAAGYAPQVSTQVFISVIALWLMLPAPAPVSPAAAVPPTVRPLAPAPHTP
jgi:hypothetical protein